MHLLATTSGVVNGTAEAIDLDQTPADLVVLSSADSELSALARAYDSLPSPKPSLRLANLLQLQHNLSVDTYVEKTLQHARLIVLRLLGGTAYWAYGINEIEAIARRRDIKLVVLPGDAQPDTQLLARSTVDAVTFERLRQYLALGGQQNTKNFLLRCAGLLGHQCASPSAPEVLPVAGLYQSTFRTGEPHAGLIFYRSVVEGAFTAPLDMLIGALSQRGIGCTAIYVSSLKDEASVTVIDELLGTRKPDVILNATSFAATSGGLDDPLAKFDCPVVQVILSGTSEQQWRASSQGLGSHDLAMNIVLPELDGRIASRAISFKADAHWHEPTQCRIVTYKPLADRISFVSELAEGWMRLRRRSARNRKVAIVLANYPNKDGRIANGVGYDTPASTIAILKALKTAGYIVGKFPETGNELIEELQRGTTNQARRKHHIGMNLGEYRKFFADLAPEVQQSVISRWGQADKDPFFDEGVFSLPVIQFENVVVAIQPARGYNIDPKSTYHDPALVPPHGYLAFYFWLRYVFHTYAVIHNGKHGNLEWLPGKATSLSNQCFPEVAFGALPQLYPFIVNDPGEGTQAKRRTSAVIIDHLTPPLTRSETYGPLKDLEVLIDEYYLASGLDRHRLDALRREILDLTRSQRLDVDAGLTGEDDSDLQRLDAYICDLKEAQIRDGLHVLGSAPTGRLENDLLVALTRVPRGLGQGGDASLIRAIADDLGFSGFDPLTCAMASPWDGPRPSALACISPDPWRTNGDTVERLELLATQIVEQAKAIGPATSKVVETIESVIHPALRACGHQEIAAVLNGLEGRLVRPGPSGAPTRGRVDVLPTGRNFYSLDNRMVPTPTAWSLGQKSAEDLLARHFQDFGQYPQSIGLSVWGTSNMRTGGDDIAQALALIGAKPVWEPSSWRLTGFEIVPLAKLNRPRVDVTLRISGFFRDAFPLQIELIDKAIRAVGELEEEPSDNPIAHRIKEESQKLIHSGISEFEARRVAGYRIFGSKPGAYGAGLQALIDEKLWSERGDLAKAYITWGAFAYGSAQNGIELEQAFTERLRRIEAVVHNQDNREHDLLDSDDYYQFEGGMTAAVEHTSGKRPRVYHNDHSRPERPVIRTLEEEVGRVMRSRVVNPKWISGAKRHGYKGAFEIAATVDYMFAFAATTGAVKTHHFDLAYDAFLADEDTREFIASNNPAALREIAQRFEEALIRGLWQPRLNSAYDTIRDLRT